MAGTITFDSAYRAIKRGELAPVYYLTGAEDVLKDELVGLITEQALDVGNRDFNFDVRTAADLGGESLHALVETPPMLAERRVVVVRNLEQWRRNAKVWSVLEAYLEHPSPSTVLVLVLGAGEKPQSRVTSRAVTVEVRPLNPDRLRRWVSTRAEGVGIVLDEDAATHLLEAVGADLSLLALELEKLAAATRSDGAVTATEVAALVGVRRGETPHDWVRAVLARDVTRAVGMLDVVLSAAGVSGVRLVSLLGTTLVGVRVGRACLDGRDGSQVERQVFDAIRAARPPGMGSWREEAAAWARAARQWNAGELDAAIAAVYEADRLLKATTVRDEGGILTDMLLHIGMRRAAA